MSDFEQALKVALQVIKSHVTDELGHTIDSVMLASAATVIKLAEEIQAYESDTFYGGDLSFEQALKVALHVIKSHVTDELGHTIDGVMLTEWRDEAWGRAGQ